MRSPITHGRMPGFLSHPKKNNNIKEGERKERVKKRNIYTETHIYTHTHKLTYKINIIYWCKVSMLSNKFQECELNVQQRENC